LGAQKPDDANRFSLSIASGALVKQEDVKESFATAQFKALSDSEKLGAQDYEKEFAGLKLSTPGDQANTSYVSKRSVRYEQVIIDNSFKRAVLRFVTLVTGMFSHFLAGNAMSRSPVSARSHAQAQPFTDKFKIGATGFVLANLADNSALGQATTHQSLAGAEQALKDALSADPALAGKVHIIRPYEMTKAA
jgi:hypothetical protein